MTLQEAFEIFYEEKNVIVTPKNLSQHVDPTEIKKKYREFSKKFHPDYNSGNKEYEAIFKEINSAKDILNNYLKNPNYINDNIIKSRFYKEYRKKENASMEEKLEIYLKKLNRAAKIHILGLYKQIYQKVKYCYLEINETIDLKEVYKRVEKLKYDVEISSKEARKISEMYIKISSKVKKHNFGSTQLEEFIKKLSGPYYDKVSDIDYKEKQEYDQEKAAELADEQFKKLCSYKDLALKRVVRAKNLIYYITIQKFINLAKETNTKLDNCMTDEELYQIFDKYDKHKNDYENELKKSLKIYKNAISKINNSDSNCVWKTLMAEIEEQIKQITTPKYYDRLADEEEYKLLVEFCQNNEERIEKYEAAIEKTRTNHKRILKEAINFKLNILKFLQIEIGEKPLEQKTKVTDKDDINKILAEEEEIDKKLLLYRQKAINKYYTYFIYHYNIIEVTSYIPSEINDIYETFLLNKTNPNIVEKCYQKLKSIYNNFKTKKSIILTEKEESIIKNDLKKDIENTRLTNISCNIEMPEELESQYRLINCLTIIELHNLNVNLNLLFNSKFKTK